MKRTFLQQVTKVLKVGSSTFKPLHSTQEPYWRPFGPFGPYRPFSSM